jgi:antigen flippase
VPVGGTLIRLWSVVASRGRWVAKANTASAAVAQTILTKGLLLVVNLATGILVARALAPTGRGQQAAMSIWPSTLSLLFLVGLPISLIYNAGRFPEERRKLFSTAIILATILGLVATVVGEFVIPLFLTKYSFEVVRFARFMLVFTLPAMLLLLFQALLEVQSDFSTSNLIRYVPPVTTLGLLIPLAMLHRLSPYSAALAYAVPMALTAMYIGWRVRAQFLLPVRGIASTAKRLLRYGGQSYTIDLLGQFSLQTAQLLVVGELKAAELGLYTIALNLSRIVNVLHVSLNVVLFPKASALSTKAILELTGRAARISTGLTVALGLFFMLAIPILLPLLYGRSFTGAVVVTWILIVEVVVSGVTSVLCQAFMATGRPGVVAALQGAGTLIAVPLMLVLIPRYGVVGAGCALLISTCTRFVLVMCSFPLLLNAKPPRLFMLRSDVRFLRERLAFVR